MAERLIGFSWGLSEHELEAARSSLASSTGNVLQIDIRAIDPVMLNSRVEDVLEEMIVPSGKDAVGKTVNAGGKLFSASFKYRGVILGAQEREDVLQVMKSFKAVLPDPQNVIFAVITRTALNWTFGEYIGQLQTEHEYVKTPRPKNDLPVKES